MSSAEILSLVGIILGLLAVMLLSYKGWSPLLVAPLGGIIILAFSGLNPLTSMFSEFVPKVASMLQSMGALYLTSFIFAKTMNDSKSTYSIGSFLGKIIGPSHAPTIVIIFSMILRLGGLNIGSYMVSYAIGVYLCSKADYYEHILLATIIGGTWTFSNTMPFFPSAHNIVCMNAMGTTNTAGLVPGLAAGIFQFVLICGFLEFLARFLKKKGMTFSAHEFVDTASMDESSFPNIFVAILPLIVFVLVFNVLKVNVAVAMLAGTLTCMVLNFKQHSVNEWFKLWQEGAKSCLPALSNLCILAGLGGVMVVTPFYNVILDILSTSSIHPYILTFAATLLMGALLGSAVTAINTCLPAFMPLFETWCATQGLDMGNFHRLMVLGALPTSTLPHNGSLVAMCDMFHTTQKKSMKYALVTGALIPALGGIVGVILAIAGCK